MDNRFKELTKELKVHTRPQHTQVQLMGELMRYTTRELNDLLWHAGLSCMGFKSDKAALLVTSYGDRQAAGPTRDRPHGSGRGGQFELSCIGGGSS